MYPIARAPDGRLVHIDAWRDDEEVTCVGCDQRLVGKRGPVNAHHFAHAVEGSCNSETVLHRSTKEAIIAAHALGPVKLWWSCVLCGETRRTTTLGLDLSREISPCEGVRSDVLGCDLTGVPRVAIEVVVTHAPEEATIAKYLEAGVSVLILRPTWEVFRELASGAEIMVDGRHARPEHVGACEGCARFRARKWWDAYVRSWGLIAARHTDDQRARQVELDAAWNVFVLQWLSVGKRYARLFDDFVGQWRKIGGAVARDVDRWRSFAAFAAIWPTIIEHEIERYRSFAAIWPMIVKHEIASYRSFAAIWPTIAEHEIARARREAARAVDVLRCVLRWWDGFIGGWGRVARRWAYDSDPRRWDTFVAAWRSIGAQVRYNWLTATEPSGRPRARLQDA